MERITGTVIWFATSKQSYGYIGYGDGKEIYVHYKGICKKNQRDPSFMTLVKGDVVSFVPAEGYYNDGTQAKDVVIEKKVEDA